MNPLLSRIKVFVTIMVVLCQGHLYAAQRKAADWKAIQSVDTLDLYSDGKFTGTMSHILRVNDRLGAIIDRTSLQIETNGFSAGEISNIELDEERTFGLDGNLLSAVQELKSPAGTSRWKLSRESSGGWGLSVTAGGTTRVREIQSLSENIAMIYSVYSGIKSRTIKAGDVFYDTSMELASGQVCCTRAVCKETPSVKNKSVWVFSAVNNLTDRDERWELDTNGNTMYQENFPYVLRRRTGRTWSVDKGRAPALFETFTIPASRVAADDESIGLALDSSLVPDTSVSRFYTKKGKTWVLCNVSAGCPKKPSNGPGDTEVAGFTVPTTTMQSGNERIKKLADSLVKGKKDRCDSIRSCFEYVNKTLKKRYSPTFSNALETLSAGFGDCGEHAVLLGALLRAAHIPARVVLGLVYMDSRKGYLYHAWAMAYTGAGNWVFVDAALGVFPATRDRVPLVIDDTGSAAMGIAKMLGRIRIEYVKK